jgi:hypothetical protein
VAVLLHRHVSTSNLTLTRGVNPEANVSGNKTIQTTLHAMLAKISGIVYLAAAGMLYGLWRLWQGKELIDMNGLGDHQ